MLSLDSSCHPYVIDGKTRIKVDLVRSAPDRFVVVRLVDDADLNNPSRFALTPTASRDVELVWIDGALAMLRLL